MAKTILPSLREKKRYLAFELVSKTKLPFSKVKRAILDSCQAYLGQLGMAKAGIIILGDIMKTKGFQDTKNPRFLREFIDQRGLVKVNNKYVNELKASLTLVRDIDKKQVIFKSLGVSGMLNKAAKKLEAS